MTSPGQLGQVPAASSMSKIGRHLQMMDDVNQDYTWMWLQPFRAKVVESPGCCGLVIAFGSCPMSVSVETPNKTCITSSII